MVSAGNQMLRAKGRAPRGPEPWSCCWSQVRALPALQGAACSFCPQPGLESPACTPVWREAGRPSAREREREEETGERERRVGLARPRSGGRLGSGSGPSGGWPGVRRWRPDLVL